MNKWNNWREERREFCVLSPRGNPSNHHWTADGSIGERVQDGDATHLITTLVTVVRLDK